MYYCKYPGRWGIMSARGTCFCIFPSKSRRKQQGSEDTTVVMVDYVLILFLMMDKTVALGIVDC